MVMAKKNESFPFTCISSFSSWSLPKASTLILHQKAVREESLPTAFRCFFSSFYPLTAPAEILLMMYLEKKQNTINIGITDKATAR